MSNVANVNVRAGKAGISTHPGKTGHTRTTVALQELKLMS